MQRARPNFVVIGYGFAGRSFHAYLLGLESRLCLHGVCARDPEKRVAAEKDHPGIKTYAAIDEVLVDDEVDGVILATPHDTHAPLAIAALDAGKHVVSDKVMCLNLAECDAMIAAAERSGKLLTVFHNRRWDGDFLTVQKLMHENKLGDVRWVECSWQRYGVWGGWRASIEKGGGRTYDLGAHMLDQVLTLFPSPVASVYARMHRDWTNAPTESHAMVTLTFADGRTVILDVNCVTRWSKPRWHVVGSDATFVKWGEDPQEKAMIAGQIDTAADAPEHYGKLYTGATRTGHEATVVPTLTGRWRGFYENLADVLTRSEPPVITLGQMRRLMTILDATFASARTGEVIRLQ